jgi:hypothetical protein
MQSPHIDLAPGQIQAIVALTNSTSTMVFDGEKPSVAAAFELAGISPDSISRYASIIRFAPALALRRSVLLEGTCSRRDVK